MRLIDADAINKYLKDNGLKRDIYVDTAPTVDSVVHGHWIDLGEHGDSNWQCDGRWKSWYLFKCSHCGNKITDMKYPYCPNCGAKMDEDTESVKE